MNIEDGSKVMSELRKRVGHHEAADERKAAKKAKTQMMSSQVEGNNVFPNNGTAKVIVDENKTQTAPGEVAQSVRNVSPDAVQPVHTMIPGQWPTTNMIPASAAQFLQMGVPQLPQAMMPQFSQGMVPQLQSMVPQLSQGIPSMTPRLYAIPGLPMASFPNQQPRMTTAGPIPAMQMPNMYPTLQCVNPTDSQQKYFVVYPDQAMVEAQARANLLFLQSPSAASMAQPQQTMAQAPLVFNRMMPAGMRIGAPPANPVAPPPTVQQPGNNASGAQALEPGQNAPVDLYMSVDDDVLSDHQIFLRKQVEYFEAGRLEVQSVTHGGRKGISIGQVGIRCKHCASLAPKKRAKGSMYYPSSFRALYQAAQNMAAGHFTSSCEVIGEEKKAQFRSFQAGKISAGHGGKKYWADCARAVRIVETENGLRFQNSGSNA